MIRERKVILAAVLVIGVFYNIILNGNLINLNKRLMTLIDMSNLDVSINGENSNMETSAINKKNPNRKTSDVDAPEVKTIRLLCWIPINPETYQEKTKVIRETWGKRCDKLVFFSNVTEEDPIAQAVDLKVSGRSGDVSGKIRAPLQYVYDNYLNDYDWFYKADDDTYCIVENLRYTLTRYGDPKVPIVFGAKMTYKQTEYFSGGAGYLLSHGALNNMINIASEDDNACVSIIQAFKEDVLSVKCIKEAGILLGDSRDNLGKERFYHIRPEQFIHGEYISWSKAGRMTFVQEKGIDNISTTAIAFHDLEDSSKLYALEFLIYEVQTYGRDRYFEQPIPARPASEL